jgi:hypothetical protein
MPAGREEGRRPAVGAGDPDVGLEHPDAVEVGPMT